MQDWKNLSRDERAARRVAWVAASGDVRRWRRWVDEMGGALAARWGTPDTPAELLAIVDTPDRLAALSEELQALDPSSEDYPERIARDVPNAGPIWIEGALPVGRRLAVVGTRSVDFEGIRLAKEIVRQIAGAGVAIVSGGALGVDTVAHQAALEVGAPTVAFLPGGLRCLTPPSNRKLFGEISRRGALVTEYPPDVSARKFHFRRRNEFIAAFADAVLVVRSRARGGTMLTARAARRVGRPLFVVPGSPEDDTSAGCLRLLREGARMVRHADDLLEDMEWGAAASDEEATQMKLDISDEARTLLSVLDDRATPAQIARAIGAPVASIHVQLLELEMAGYVEKRPGSALYRRTER